MRIVSMRVRNYKCFGDSGPIELSKTFNVFVGRNDSGKSTLLEVLGVENPNKPHMGLRTQPNHGDPPTGDPSTEIAFELDSTDLSEWLLPSLGNDFGVPVTTDDAATTTKYRAMMQTGCELVATFRAKAPPNARIKGWDATIVDHHTLIRHARGKDGQPELTAVGQQQSSNPPTALSNIASFSRAKIYVFRAERLNVGESSAKGVKLLERNASNLPEVLNRLISADPGRFDRLLGHVRAVFPHITRITAPLTEGTHNARIRVWTTPPELERDDLAIPLTESGTGIGQVLALLYVVVTSNSPTVIAIDEPQSFLHPGAVRKLLEILRGYPKFQYLITTHSPFALDLAGEDSIFLVKRGTEGSLVDRLDPGRREGLHRFLAEVGARVSDVFLADRILWVEGKTEEACFPLLLRRLERMQLGGTDILGVVSTDELLEGKHASRVFDIYDRLTAGPSLMPPAVAFLFDREGRTPQQMDDLSRRPGGLVKWLPRRMYESYLLDPAALTKTINELDNARSALLEQSSTVDWFTRRGSESRYVDDHPGVYPEPSWFANVRGDRLLQDLFSEMTEARVEYDKVKHGEALTRLLVETPTPDIRELARFLRHLIEMHMAHAA